MTVQLLALLHRATANRSTLIRGASVLFLMLTLLPAESLARRHRFFGLFSGPVFRQSSPRMSCGRNGCSSGWVQSSCSNGRCGTFSSCGINGCSSDGQQSGCGCGNCATGNCGCGVNGCGTSNFANSGGFTSPAGFPSHGSGFANPASFANGPQTFQTPDGQTEEVFFPGSNTATAVTNPTSGAGPQSFPAAQPQARRQAIKLFLSDNCTGCQGWKDAISALGLSNLRVRPAIFYLRGSDGELYEINWFRTNEQAWAALAQAGGGRYLPGSPQRGPNAFFKAPNLTLSVPTQAEVAAFLNPSSGVNTATNSPFNGQGPASGPIATDPAGESIHWAVAGDEPVEAAPNAETPATTTATTTAETAAHDSTTATRPISAENTTVVRDGTGTSRPTAPATNPVAKPTAAEVLARMLQNPAQPLNAPDELAAVWEELKTLGDARAGLEPTKTVGQITVEYVPCTTECVANLHDYKLTSADGTVAYVRAEGAAKERRITASATPLKHDLALETGWETGPSTPRRTSSR